MIPNLHNIVGTETSILRGPIPDEWIKHPSCLAGDLWTNGELLVIMSTDILRDKVPQINGSSAVDDEILYRWLHVSVSRRDMLPSWEDLKKVKDVFIGKDHEAVQVLPKEQDYVNLHKYCLHLWSPEE